MIMFVAIFVIMILALFITGIGSVFGACTVGGVNSYDESTMQNYANKQYAAAFGDTADYEGNILLVFTVYEDFNGYETIAWVGYNIDDRISEMYGNEYTKYGQTVMGAIPDHYEYSLSKNLQSIVNKMAIETEVYSRANGNVDTRFSRLINNSSLSLSEETVNSALVDFTQRTGINIAIVVADGETVFGEAATTSGAIMIIAAIILVVVVVLAIKNGRKSGGAPSGGNTSKTDPNAGQGKYDPNTGTYTN